VHKGGKKLIVSLKDGKEFKIEGPLSLYDIVDPQQLGQECNNLANCDQINEGTILYHVKDRFTRGTIYTNVGNILISINPYRALDIYDNNVKGVIWDKINSSKESTIPHIYQIAASSLHTLYKTNKSQSILISGESGSGKTEATKKILEFISYKAIPNYSTTVVDQIPIESKILDSNPILESFGNAKTLRNNNSSRFGKYMKIFFEKEGSIKSSLIETYLLEKNRVVYQAENERNYHIYYMLLTGASKDMKKDFGLKDKDIDSFHYLNQSGCIKISGRMEKKRIYYIS
jgi:myosin protein heavy chain